MDDHSHFSTQKNLLAKYGDEHKQERLNLNMIVDKNKKYLKHKILQKTCLKLKSRDREQ